MVQSPGQFSATCRERETQWIFVSRVRPFVSISWPAGIILALKLADRFRSAVDDIVARILANPDSLPQTGNSPAVTLIRRQRRELEWRYANVTRPKPSGSSLTETTADR